jgi:hypothetical protein
MKTASLRTYLVVTAIMFAICIRDSYSQTPGTGAISGVVYDPANRVLANARVEATNEDTQVSRWVATASDGAYRIPLLLPGVYTVAVTAAGFNRTVAHAVIVTVSEISTLNMSMPVTGPNTNVQVKGGAQIADLEGSTLGGLLDHQAIESLPLSSRNYTQILGLSPGVIADLATSTTLGNGTENVAANGATPTSNNIQFNGIDANNLQENSAAAAQNYEVGVAVPAQDTIEEFRVQTANFDAAYGRGSGANVDLVSRNGTDNLHGSAWEFVRNNLFNSNDFFSKLTGQPRAELKQNEFGGALGGPIRKGRTFFFVAYQGVTQANGLGTLKTVELPQFTSDRSPSALGAQFCPATHLDSSGLPSLGYMTAAGGEQVACDGSNINPVAIAILNAKLPNGQFAIPNPQVALPPGAGSDPSDQLPLGLSTFSPPSHYREDQATANIDQVVNSKNTLATRFFYSRGTVGLPFAPNGENLPGWGTNALNRNTIFVLADTHVFSPTLINVARFGYTRFDGLVSQQNPIDASSVGIGTPTGASGPGFHIPFTSVAGFNFGDGGTPSDWSVTNSFNWQDTVALFRGRNSVRFGAEIKRHEVDENQPQQADGNITLPTLGDFLLGESAAQNQSPLGVSNLSLSGAGAGIFRRNERYVNFAGFAQYDVKLAQRLTVNAGVRYEVFSAPIETDGRLTNFDPAIATSGAIPATGTFAGYRVPSNFVGPFPQGVVKDGFAGFYRTPFGDVSPRSGFSWQILDRPVLVLRGGFGIYFDEHSANIAEQTLGQAPFAISQFIGGPPNGAATLRNPYSPLLPVSSSFPIFSPLMPGGFPFIEGTNPNLKDGKTYEYNLNVQYAIGHNALFQAAYVGTRSVNRPGQIEFDQSLLASPENPVNGETANSVDNVVARMPIQGVSPGSLFTDSVFEGSFNALELSFTKRMANGFQLQASYTWSKNLDEVNGEGGTDVFELQLPTNDQHNLRQSSYGLANDDRDQRFVANFVWETPRFGGVPTAVRRALNGWKFSGIGLIQSGAASSVFDGNAGSVYGLLGGEVRAELAPRSPRSTKGSLYSRVVSGPYLNAAGFMRAPEVANGTSIADEDFGNSGVGIVRGPGQHNLDLAVERSIAIREGKQFVLRAETFNLSNTPQFGDPNTSLGYGNPLLPAVASPGFGLITGEQGGPHPRIVQLAVKFQF